MYDIFDEEYIPGSFDDVHLFDLKNICMYTVFTSTLLTDKVKSLVRKYERD